MSETTKLSMTASEVVGALILENGLHTNDRMKLVSFALDFLRMFYQDNKKGWGMHDRDKEVVFTFDRRGYNDIPIPSECFEILLVGVQIGRFVKALAMNQRLIQRAPTATFGVGTAASGWYMGGFGYGTGMGWGWGLGTFGQNPGSPAWGNGQDYGDYNIDWENKRIITSPTYPWTNLVLRYFPNCISVSDDTCVHPFFITAMKHYVMKRHFLSRGELALSREYERLFTQEYGTQISRRNTLTRPSIIKIFERRRGYQHG